MLSVTAITLYTVHPRWLFIYKSWIEGIMLMEGVHLLSEIHTKKSDVNPLGADAG